MGALEDYVRAERAKVKRRDNPMADSVMSKPAESMWQPEYISEPALEAPMVSPDDLIGTGLPTKLAALAGKPAMGALGMLIGQRGAGRIGNQHLIDVLGRELESAGALKRAGKEYRMQSNSGQPLTHTGFDGRPRREVDDALFLPRRDQVYDKEVPFLSQWKVDPRIEQAGGDELANLKIINTLNEPVNSGAFDSNKGLLTLGHGPSVNARTNEVYSQYPHIRDQRIRTTAGHELTHFMQNLERWGGGTSPESMRDVLMTKNRESELNRHVNRASFLDTIGRGDIRPEDAYQMFQQGGADSGTLRQLQSYLQALKDGRMTPADALDQGQFHQQAAATIMRGMKDQKTLQDLSNAGILQRSSPGILEDAKSFITDPANLYPKETPDEAMTRYLLYRANAGEQEAEMVGERLNLDASGRRNIPFASEPEFPLDLTHKVRGFADGGLVSHSALVAARDRPGADQQALAPQEHRAFAREWVKENPLLAVPSLLAAIPGYSAAKRLGLVRARTPASLEEMAEGYRGVAEGLGLDKLWNE